MEKLSVIMLFYESAVQASHGVVVTYLVPGIKGAGFFHQYSRFPVKEGKTFVNILIVLSKS